MNTKNRNSNSQTRTVTDHFGSINISNDVLWGPQTQRSLTHFAIGHDRMPFSIIHSYLLLKQATTEANRGLGILSGKKAKLILDAIQELLDMGTDVMRHFPLSIWQAGSGAHTHFNINEVIAHLANNVSPNTINADTDVNASQSTNDTFPTVMHISASEQCVYRLMPAISKLRSSFSKLETKYALTIKIGRTHLQDSLPMTYGQMFSAYQTLLSDTMNMLHHSLDGLFELAIGGTVVGTGFGSPNDFDQIVTQHLSELLKLPFSPSLNKFAAISAHSGLLNLMGCLVNLACNLNKIANDLRFLGSGPRAGIGELLLPENELGSMKIPGKINPTQCEALSMVCMQVLGQYQSVAFACASGHLELNTYKPVIIYNVLHSIELLSDAMLSFEQYCIRGIMVHEINTDNNLKMSLVLANALLKEMTYDKILEIITLATADNSSIKAACMKLEYLSAKRLDELLDPANMIGSYDI